MKKTIRITLIPLGITLSLILLAGCGSPTANTPAASAEGGIAWLRSVDEAQKASADRDAVIMADVYTDWCVWCKKLDAEVFVDGKVVEISRTLVNLKVNAEDNGPGMALAQQFGVDGYPTILFLKDEGGTLQEVDRIVGFLPAADFAAEMERIAGGGATFASLMAGYQSGTLDVNDQYRLASKYMQRGQAAQAQEILVKIDPASLADEDARKGLIMTLFNAEFQQQRYTEAEKYLMDFLGQFPTDENAARVRYYLLLTNGMQRDLPGAKAALAELKAKNPEAGEMIAQAENAVAELEKQLQQQ